MTKPTSPFEIDPPTSRQLVKSSVIAIAGALLVLVLIVLPAEYGVDPTGCRRIHRVAFVLFPVAHGQVTMAVLRHASQNFFRT